MLFWFAAACFGYLREELPSFRPIVVSGEIEDAPWAGYEGTNLQMVTMESTNRLAAIFRSCISIQKSKFLEMSGFLRPSYGIGAAALLMDSELLVSDVYLESCLANMGGGFGLFRVQCHMSRVTFYQCCAYRTGGALVFSSYLDTEVSVQESDDLPKGHSGPPNFEIDMYYITMESCTVDYCVAGEFGGGISVTGCPDLLCSNCSFLACFCNRNGGAISLTFTRCALIGCLFEMCTVGGVVMIPGTFADFSNIGGGPRDSAYAWNPGGGAIYCHCSIPRTDRSDMAILITERCCFVENECAPRDNGRVYPGFDIMLENMYSYSSNYDFFLNYKNYSISCEERMIKVLPYLIPRCQKIHCRFGTRHVLRRSGTSAQSIPFVDSDHI